MKNIKCILFDFDGVLCDLCEVHKIALNTAMKKTVGFNITDRDHYAKFNGLPTSKKLEMLHEQGHIKKDDIQKISDLKQKLTLKEITNIKPDKTRSEILEYLTKKQIIIAVVSNAKRETITQALKKMGLWEYISFVVSNDDTTKNKPNPDPYLLAINRSRFDKSEIIAIEDNENGVIAAVDAGIECIQIMKFDELTLDLIKQIC